MNLRLNFFNPIGPRRVPGTRPGPLTVRPVQSGFGGVNMDGYMGALPAGYMGAPMVRHEVSSVPVPSREGARLRAAAQGVVGVGGCGGLGGALSCNSTGRDIMQAAMTVGGMALNAWGGKQGARGAQTLNAGNAAWSDACQRRSQNQSSGSGNSVPPSSNDAVAEFLRMQDARQRDAESRRYTDTQRQQAAAAAAAASATKAKGDQTKWLIGGALALGVVALVVLK